MTLQDELPKELEYLSFPRRLWKLFSVWFEKDNSLHSLISCNNLSVWDLKELGPQEPNEFFLVDFLVTMWSNVFYQSLKYLTSEDLGKGVT